MTLNDLERHSSSYFAYFTEFGSFGADYVKVVDEGPTVLSTKI